MPDTTRGYTYPDSTGSANIWEHFQELAEDVDTDVGEIVALTSERPLCILRKATITSVDNLGEILTWDIEEVDTAGIHSTGSRITPNVAGWYRFTATITFSANTTGRRGIAIYINGGTATYGQTVFATGSGNITVTVTATRAANGSTDYFEVFAYQDSGGGLNSADIVSTRFEAEFIR
jgi:hypothetical protein